MFKKIVGVPTGLRFSMLVEGSSSNLCLTVNPHYYIVLFFFFQAEDGIRDLTVTGVQTCALPIYAFQSHRYRRLLWLGAARQSTDPRQHEAWGSQRPNQQLEDVPEQAAQKSRQRRSEERRVGKECRSRWSPYH